ncbi:MAG: homoserine dehydrogenase [Anaerolineales bacterium]|nr:homoserine dehydrogenase [Anaerolineales bacterium]
MHYRLAFLGFGNVGQALARLLLRKRQELKQVHQLSFSVVGVATGRRGRAIDPTGLDLEQVLKHIETNTSLDTLTKAPVESSLEFIQKCDSDVLFENTPVNHQNGEPAISHLKTALGLSMHAITANKGPVVHAYQELVNLANQKERCFFFESTVLDGAPVFSLFRDALPAARVKSFRGILNSTTNLILTRMEKGESFEDAVEYTQKIGIAESDPVADLDGWDAAIKVAALVTVLMGVPTKPQDVPRQGIAQIAPNMIAKALEDGKRYKMICSARLEGEQVEMSVQPQMVTPESPLYQVQGTSCMIEFETDVLGLLSLGENDPTPETTAYGLLADFINAVTWAGRTG